MSMSPDTTTCEDGIKKTFLQILEQPIEKFRFRYRREYASQKVHGAIHGEHSTKQKKTFPTVKLCNYDGPAFVRCTLSSADPKNRRLHPHCLVAKCPYTKEDKDEPIDINLERKNRYEASFQSMVITHTQKHLITDELIRKKRQIESGKQIDEIRKEAEEESKNVEMNRVSLRFDALRTDPKTGDLIKICDPVFSNPVKNSRSPETSDLRICRSDKYRGSCHGDDEVFIFVDKICKTNIRIRFFELDENNKECWHNYAKFSPETDVHYQYAIAFRTPPYINLEIDKPVKVYYVLERISDEEWSERQEFEYKPDIKTRIGGKRKATEPVSFPSPTLQLPVQNYSSQRIRRANSSLSSYLSDSTMSDLNSDDNFPGLAEAFPTYSDALLGTQQEAQSTSVVVTSKISQNMNPECQAEYMNVTCSGFKGAHSDFLSTESLQFLPLDGQSFVSLSGIGNKRKATEPVSSPSPTLQLPVQNYSPQCILRANSSLSSYDSTMSELNSEDNFLQLGEVFPTNFDPLLATQQDAQSTSGLVTSEIHQNMNLENQELNGNIGIGHSDGALLESQQFQLCEEPLNILFPESQQFQLCEEPLNILFPESQQFQLCEEPLNILFPDMVADGIVKDGSGVEENQNQGIEEGLLQANNAIAHRESLFDVLFNNLFTNDAGGHSYGIHNVLKDFVSRTIAAASNIVKESVYKLSSIVMRHSTTDRAGTEDKPSENTVVKEISSGKEVMTQRLLMVKENIPRAVLCEFNKINRAKKRMVNKEMRRLLESLFSDVTDHISGDSVLHLAVMYGKEKELETLLDMCKMHNMLSCIDCKNIEQKTPLHVAAKLEQEKSVELLLRYSADSGIQDTFGNTPLHYATIGQNINIVNRLVNAMKTSDIDARNEGGQAALHIAVRRKSYEIVEALLGAGADVNNHNACTGDTALHISVYNRDIEMVIILLKEDTVDIDVDNLLPCSPLEHLLEIKDTNAIEEAIINALLEKIEVYYSE